jgi:hypothetical protein
MSGRLAPTTRGSKRKGVPHRVCAVGAPRAAIRPGANLSWRLEVYVATPERQVQFRKAPAGRGWCWSTAR